KNDRSGYAPHRHRNLIAVFCLLYSLRALSLLHAPPAFDHSITKICQDAPLGRAGMNGSS
ncbi:MAG: hypothetical protein ACREJN_12395, partial [Nitrospiraceae bacterium]